MPATTRAAIAIVEDDGGVRTALRELLRSAGFAADSFASAEDFLASGRDPEVDCVVADINLPGMSGVVLLQTMAAAGRRARVVLITGRDDPATLELIERAGAAPLLRKPFGDDELFDVLRDALQA
jgi:FixJ family two-component response regulator